MVSGRYVKTFREASHALPNGMHMNSDYPLMLPKISYITAKEVVLHDHFGREYRAPIRTRNGSEVCYITMVSTFERIFRRGKPTRYRFEPFKDERSDIAPTPPPLPTRDSDGSEAEGRPKDRSEA